MAKGLGGVGRKWRGSESDGGEKWRGMSEVLVRDGERRIELGMRMTLGSECWM